MHSLIAVENILQLHRMQNYFCMIIQSRSTRSLMNKAEMFKILQDGIKEKPSEQLEEQVKRPKGQNSLIIYRDWVQAKVQMAKVALKNFLPSFQFT